MSAPNPTNPDSPKVELKEVPDLSQHLVEIELEKNPVLGFGFNIIGGVDEPHIPGHPGIFISRINPEGPAFKDGRLRLGDRIASLNDTSLALKTHSDAVDIFRQASGKVRLLIEQDAETLILSRPCAVVPAPVTDSTVEETLRLSILKSSSTKSCVSPSNTSIKSGSPTSAASDTSVSKKEVTMTATVAATPIDVTTNPSFQLDKPIPGSETNLNENGIAPIENGTVAHTTTRRQSFREPLVTVQPSETSHQNNIPTVVFPIKAVPVEEEEDRASTISVAPSVYSVIDDVPRTPKKPSSWLDPSSLGKKLSGLWSSLKNTFRR